MTKLEKLEREVQRLSHAEMVAFRAWFRKYDSDEWDRQIEEDARTGKLDSLAEEAVSAYRTGRIKEI
jgi:hypothetical protein